MRVENQTKTRLCPETLTKTAVQEFHLRIIVSMYRTTQVLGNGTPNCKVGLFLELTTAEKQ
jgi:hypothetical protein